ncbi:hypothetical protein Agub_g6846 [Astrephomene gubernaculifera]|uniref:Uncharacterized protein n=1 Tax=Astrephomene gubernaculifera TaxID=47775 RepID=A0AAD3DP35_9CHLO|nr:hypothetical protein Agub_g6846 [Astrephomene gubernaculifera]
MASEQAATNGTVSTGSDNPPVAAVLFDMDGLLLDTESAYTVAQQRILDRFGAVFTWQHKALMMGRAAMEAAQLLLAELALGPEQITPEQFLAERDALLESVFPSSPLMPGAERLVRHLAACGVPMALATGSHRASFLLKTSRHAELFSLFQHVVTGDMVPKAKPDPAIFLMALEGLKQRLQGGQQQAGQGQEEAVVVVEQQQLQQEEAAVVSTKSSSSSDGGAAAVAITTTVEVTATATAVPATQPPAPAAPPAANTAAGSLDVSRVLVFEDAPNGVAAALAGGMRVVMVPYPGLPEELSAGCGASAVLRSLEEFRPEQWGLPPFPE